MNPINREEFSEAIVNIGRVTKVVKGGSRFRFGRPNLRRAAGLK